MKKEIDKLNKNIIISCISNNDNKKQNPSLIKNKILEFKNKITEFKEAKSQVKAKTERENFKLNESSNEEENYSIELGNEEEEFDSDEYISSTMLDVETNTYIELLDKKSNESISDISKKIYNKSPYKIKNQNVDNLAKNININSKYLLKNKTSEISNSSIKKVNNYISSSPKINKKDILYKKLNIQNNIERIDEKVKKLKIKKNFKIENKNRENDKNYSMIGYNSPINSLYSKENLLKLDRIKSNLLNLIQNNTSSKNEYKKIKIDLNNIKNNINIKNKTIKYEKNSTMINNNNFININNNIKDKLIKKYNKKIKNSKYKIKKVLSPKKKKFGINSMKILNSKHAIHNSEIPSSSLFNNIINNNNIIYYTKKNLINCNNTINTNNNNNNSNNTINFNNLNNNINNIIFSPLRRIIDKKSNRKTTPTYSQNPFNLNSISIENNNISNNINITNNKISDKLLTYNFHERKYLSRNRTFKNKRHLNNKNKFFNLFFNKKKMNLLYAQDTKRNIKSKSPKMLIKINNLKKITDNISKKNQNNQKKINIPKLKIKNVNNYMSKNSYLISYINSYSNRKQNEKNIRNKHNLYRREKKLKQFIYIKKENLSNIIRTANNKNYDNNPYNQGNKNNYYNNNNLSLSKSNKRNINNGNSENKDKEFNTNLTSINAIKNELKNKKINLEIESRKKNKYRAKTLIEEDYLRDILINNKDINEKEINKDNHLKGNKFFKNNRSVNNNLYVNPLNYKKINKKFCERKNNYSPSIKDNIIKSPTERRDINFNININMNNNDYKKVICYYHRHNNSLINYSYAGKKEKNFNLPFNKIMKKEKNLFNTREFSKMIINEAFNNNINSNYINGGEYNNANNIYNNSEIAPNSFYNNIINQNNGSTSSFINKKKKYNFNENIKKQFSKIQNYKNFNKKKNNKKEKSENEKNNIKKNQIDNNNTLNNIDYGQSKSFSIKGNSNKNIKISNNNSGIKNFYHINNNKSNFVITNDLKNINQKYADEIRSKIDEIIEPY